MSGPIIYVDHSEIREGKLDALKTAMSELARFVEANEPRLLAYEVYFRDDGARMKVLHIHSDPASLEFHMQVAGPLFPRFAQFVRLLSIEVYGEPGEQLVARLQQKAALLGSGTVQVHRLHAGFARLPGL